MGNFDFNYVYKMNIQHKTHIEDAYVLYQTEREAFERHSRLCKLTQMSVVEQVRSFIRYDWAMLFIQDAQEWICMLEKGVDKRKKYAERDGYNNLVSHLKRIFDCDTIQIIDIIQYGYDSYGYRIEFITDNDYIYLLHIPDPSKYSITNMAELGLCECRFGYKSQRDNMRYISQSYDPCEFRDILREIPTKKEYKVHYTYDEFLQDNK